MKKIAIAFMCVFALVQAPTVAKADFFNIGIEGAVNIPIPDYDIVYGIGLGGFARVTLSPFGDLGFLGKIGFLYQMGKDYGAAGSTPDMKLIPVILGIHYDIAAVLDAELALALTTLAGDSTDFEPGMFAGIGVEFVNFRLAANIYAISLEHMDVTTSFMITLGWGFGV